MIREVIYFGLIIGCCYYQGLFDFSGQKVKPLREYGEVRIVRKTTTTERFSKWTKKDGLIKMPLKDALNEYYDFLGERLPYEDYSRRKSKKLKSGKSRSRKNATAKRQQGNQGENSRGLKQFEKNEVKDNGKSKPDPTPEKTALFKFNSHQNNISHLTQTDDPVYKKYMELNGNRDAMMSGNNTNELLQEISRRHWLKNVTGRFYEELQSLLIKREDYSGNSLQFHQLHAEYFKNNEEFGRNLLVAYNALPKDSVYVRIRQLIPLVTTVKVRKPYKRHEELLDVEQREHHHVQRSSAFKANERDSDIRDDKLRKELNHEFRLLKSVREEHNQRIIQELNMEKYEELWNDLLEKRQVFIGNDLEFEFEYGVEIRATEVLCKEMLQAFARIAHIKAQQLKWEKSKLESTQSGNNGFFEKGIQVPKEVIRYRKSVGHAQLENDLIVPLMPFYKAKFHFGKLRYMEDDYQNEVDLDTFQKINHITRQYHQYIGSIEDEVKMYLRMDELKQIYEQDLEELKEALSQSYVNGEYETYLSKQSNGVELPSSDELNNVSTNMYEGLITDELPLSQRMSLYRLRRATDTSGDSVDFESELHNDFNPVYQKLDSVKNEVLRIGAGLRDSIYKVYKFIKSNSNEKTDEKKIEENLHRTFNPLQKKVDNVTQSLFNLGTNLRERIYNAFEFFQSKQHDKIEKTDTYRKSEEMMSKNDRYKESGHESSGHERSGHRESSHEEFHHAGSDHAGSDHQEFDHEGFGHKESGYQESGGHEGPSHEEFGHKESGHEGFIPKTWKQTGSGSRTEEEKTKKTESSIPDTQNNIDIVDRIGKNGYVPSDRPLYVDDGFGNVRLTTNKKPEISGERTQQMARRSENLNTNKPRETVTDKSNTHSQADHEFIEQMRTNKSLAANNRNLGDSIPISGDEKPGENKTKPSSGDIRKTKWYKRWQLFNQLKSKALKQKAQKASAASPVITSEEAASISANDPNISAAISEIPVITTPIPHERNQIIPPSQENSQEKDSEPENIDTEISDNEDSEDADDDELEDVVSLDINKFEKAGFLDDAQLAEIQKMANEWTTERNKMHQRAHKKHGNHAHKKPIPYTVTNQRHHPHQTGNHHREGNPGLMDDPRVFDYQYDNALDDLEKSENNHGDIEENYVDTSVNRPHYKRKTEMEQENEIIPDMTTEDEEQLKYLEKLRDAILEKRSRPDADKTTSSQTRMRRNYDNENDDEEDFFGDDETIEQNEGLRSDNSIGNNIESVEVFDNKQAAIDPDLLPEPYKDEFYESRNEDDIVENIKNDF